MQRVILRCFTMTVLVLVTLSLGGGSSVEAQEPKNLNALLRGDYAFTLTKVCVQGSLANVPGGGDLFEPPPRLRLRGFAGRNTRVTQGIFRYNGDGTGSATARSLLVIDNVGSPGSSPVRQNQFSCNLTYVVNPDRSFTQQLACAGTRLAGAFAELDPPEALTLEGVRHQGQIGIGRRVLVFSDTEVNVEEFTATGIPSLLQSICGQSGTAVKLRGRQ
ncbi:MAG: hypothetical protein ACE5HK_00205 [Candidatus Methylomirabilales bacterium]